MHQEVTTDELKREYQAAHLWATGISYQRAVADPLIRSSLEFNARRKQRRAQPKQGRLL